jgi:hypothetical protein
MDIVFAVFLLLTSPRRIPRSWRPRVRSYSRLQRYIGGCADAGSRVSCRLYSVFFFFFFCNDRQCRANQCLATGTYLVLIVAIRVATTPRLLCSWQAVYCLYQRAYTHYSKRATSGVFSYSTPPPRARPAGTRHLHHVGGGVWRA